MKNSTFALVASKSCFIALAALAIASTSCSDTLEESFRILAPTRTALAGSIIPITARRSGGEGVACARLSIVGPAVWAGTVPTDVAAFDASEPDSLPPEDGGDDVYVLVGANSAFTELMVVRANAPISVLGRLYSIDTLGQCNELTIRQRSTSSSFVEFNTLEGGMRL